MLEIAPATLRTWESRYAMVEPGRSPGGQRLYSREQVEQLQFVKKLVASGSKPAEAHRLLAERLRATPSNAADKPGVRIHCAEADTPAGETLRRCLQEEGYEVELTTNGHEGTPVVEILRSA
jgi:DNA-binding transcriptional MerR regulator